jgi:hypothetical protein
MTPLMLDRHITMAELAVTPADPPIVRGCPRHLRTQPSLLARLGNAEVRSLGVQPYCIETTT